MKSGTILLTYHNGIYETTALIHECGLAVHRSLHTPQLWTVTHIASGKLVSWDKLFNTVELAWRWLLAIQGVLPWHEQTFDEYDYHAVRVELIEAEAEVLIV